MAIPPEPSAGSPTEVTHETLRVASTDTLPQQRTQLGDTRQAVTARQVPAAAFSELGAAASSGHNRNIDEIAGRLTGAADRYAGLIQGVGDTTRKFQAFDEEQAGRQRQEQVQLAQARRRQPPVSQNGWPTSPNRGWRTVPGSSTRLNVADGPAGDVLVHVAGQLHSRVESFDLDGPKGEGPDDWGYANRNIGGSTDTSNHASGTAFDMNATRHPRFASGTFTPAQVGEIHTILGEVDGVVRWGGDYSNPRRLDEMHFEIVGTPAEVERVAERLRHENAAP